MIIGVLKEIKPNEYRVAAVPDTVRELVAKGHEVYVEHDAGKIAGSTDEVRYADAYAGAIVAPPRTSTAS